MHRLVLSQSFSMHVCGEPHALKNTCIRSSPEDEAKFRMICVHTSTMKSTIMHARKSSVYTLLSHPKAFYINHYSSSRNLAALIINHSTSDLDTLITSAKVVTMSCMYSIHGNNVHAQFLLNLPCIRIG